ncbi:GntR family transcriptional regulator [Hansschlegelia sp. KR7-227]|uniref:GntR family transcriptional regulator n=1 Tax=Hansschlegelia sp. KR7-227 TaxID=3400914 RepID=UPI003C007737
MPVNRENAATVAPERRSLVDDAYDALKAGVLDGSFAPGHQASEQEIALRLGMSRTPVHEAVIRLQEDGLVRVLSRRGVLICAIAPDDMREIYDVLVAIEGRAAELIAALPEPDRLAVADDLARFTEEMEAALASENRIAWGETDARFHAALIGGCRNRRIVRIMQTINDQSHRARMVTLRLRKGLAASVEEHRAIVAAIRAGDAAAAHEAGRRHRLNACAELIPALESLGLKHL